MGDRTRGRRSRGRSDRVGQLGFRVKFVEAQIAQLVARLDVTERKLDKLLAGIAVLGALVAPGTWDVLRKILF